MGADTGYGEFEFERTFLAYEPYGLRTDDPTLIVQGYFLASDGYALRVRVQAPGLHLDRALTDAPPRDHGAVVRGLLTSHRDTFDFCALTAKGPYVGGTRYEAERELDVSIGVEMLWRCSNIVVKNRYPLWLGVDGWVVDVFGGANAGLVLAEVERGGPVTDLEIPDFCRTEVTDDPRFGNESLSVRPWPTFAAQVEGELAATGPRFLADFGHNHFLEGER